MPAYYSQRIQLARLSVANWHGCDYIYFTNCFERTDTKMKCRSLFTVPSEVTQNYNSYLTAHDGLYLLEDGRNATTLPRWRGSGITAPPSASDKKFSSKFLHFLFMSFYFLSFFCFHFFSFSLHFLSFPFIFLSFLFIFLSFSFHFLSFPFVFLSLSFISFHFLSFSFPFISFQLNRLPSHALSAVFCSNLAHDLDLAPPDRSATPWTSIFDIEMAFSSRLFAAARRSR